MEYYDFREVEEYKNEKSFVYKYPKYNIYFTIKNFEIVNKFKFGDKDKYRYKYLLKLENYDIYYELLKHEIILFNNFDYEDYEPRNNVFAYGGNYYINIYCKDKIERNTKKMNVEVRRLTCFDLKDFYVEWRRY